MKAKDPEKAREIGARITQARQEAGGMKQRELAELLGVSERSIQAYEQGETTPYRFGNDLERVFGRPPSWFWDGQDGISGGNAENLLQILVSEVRSFRHFVEGELLDIRAELGRLAAH